MNYSKVSVIGCGRWGGFLGYYIAKYLYADVLFYGLEKDLSYQGFLKKKNNGYVPLLPNMRLTLDLEEALQNDFIIISIGCQNLRSLCQQLNQYNLSGKTFLLAMKGLEESTGKRLTQVFAEEIRQENVHLAVLLGPGHVQDYLQGIPSCVVIDAPEEETKHSVANYLNSNLIRTYYGIDLIGNEIGAALKNVIGIGAGILDGLNYHGLKGALMSRAPLEVGRFIELKGGNKMSAYGLAHLGDYEATLFSAHSHNRKFGELFAKGENFGKLAEGVATLKSLHTFLDKLEMPICNSLYAVIHNKADISEQLSKLFIRPQKDEFMDRK